VCRGLVRQYHVTSYPKFVMFSRNKDKPPVEYEGATTAAGFVDALKREAGLKSAGARQQALQPPQLLPFLYSQKRATKMVLLLADGEAPPDFFYSSLKHRFTRGNLQLVVLGHVNATLPSATLDAFGVTGLPAILLCIPTLQIGRCTVLQGPTLESTAGLTGTKDNPLYQFAKITTARMSKDISDTVPIPSLESDVKRDEL
jgi:hypothetical protein